MPQPPDPAKAHALISTKCSKDEVKTQNNQIDKLIKVFCRNTNKTKESKTFSRAHGNRNKRSNKENGSIAN